MAYSVKDHILHRDGKPVAQAKTPNIGGALKPTLLVMHYTASQSAKGAIAWLCNPKAEASAHLVVDEMGVVTQLAPFNRQTWHAGVSKWKTRTGCNAFSIGIEMSNPGWLKQLAAGRFVDSVGKSVPADRVAWLAHKATPKFKLPWATYPAAQIDACVEIAQAICKAYAIKEIVGHEDIAPRRKRDPGPAFDMLAFVSRVFGRK